MIDRVQAEDRQEQARTDALEAKWTAYEERAKQILADEFYQLKRSRCLSPVDTLLEQHFDNPEQAIMDNGDYQEYREAVAKRDWPEVGRIQGRSFETIARKLAESDTFRDRLAEIVSELDEDARYE